MNDTRFCKNCKFIRLFQSVDPEKQTEYARCAHPKATLEDVEFYVSGVGEPSKMAYCSTMRQTDCGKDAKFFEPAEVDTEHDIARAALRDEFRKGTV